MKETADRKTTRRAFLRQAGLLAAGGLLTACAPQTPFLTPVHTQTIQPTETPTATPVPPTFTPEPTFTPTPTSTPDVLGKLANEIWFAAAASGGLYRLRENPDGSLAVDTEVGGNSAEVLSVTREGAVFSRTDLYTKDAAPEGMIFSPENTNLRWDGERNTLLIKDDLNGKEYEYIRYRKDGLELGAWDTTVFRLGIPEYPEAANWFSYSTLEQIFKDEGGAKAADYIAAFIESVYPAMEQEYENNRYPGEAFGIHTGNNGDAISPFAYFTVTVKHNPPKAVWRMNAGAGPAYIFGHVIESYNPLIGEKTRYPFFVTHEEAGYKELATRKGELKYYNMFDFPKLYNHLKSKEQTGNTNLDYWLYAWGVIEDYIAGRTSMKCDYEAAREIGYPVAALLYEIWREKYPDHGLGRNFLANSSREGYTPEQQYKFKMEMTRFFLPAMMIYFFKRN